MKIGIDMDGVIARFTMRAIENCKKVFGLEVIYDEIRIPQFANMIWDQLTVEQQANYPTKGHLYNDLCPPGFFEELEPFPGAIQAVKDLYSAGHKIIFLTKPLEWKYSAPEKIAWLKYFFSDIEYRVIMVSDMTCKHLVGVDVLVDDDPRALIKLPPYHGICISQPWNKEFREKSYNGIVAEDFRAAAQFLLNNEKMMGWFDKGGLDATTID